MHEKSTDEIYDYIYTFCESYIYLKMETDSPRVKKIIRDAVLFIKENLHDFDLNLKVVAEKMLMNPTYFGQIFKKDLGKSFNEYLTELRLDEARKLLQSHEIKVYEIADKIGF
jgi:two-component system response regulator YesN